MPSKLIATPEFVSILEPDRTGGVPLSLATARQVASLYLGSSDGCAAVFDHAGSRIGTSANYNEFFGLDAEVYDRTRMARTTREEWLTERSRFAHTTAITCRPCRVVEIGRGWRVESFFAAVQDDRSAETFVLQTTRRSIRCHSGDSSGGSLGEVSIATFHTWGSLESLSRRQLEVLRLVTRGYGNDRIGAAIGRTKRAVEWHIRGLFAKLQVSDRVQLHVVGMRAGLDDIPDDAWHQIISRRFPNAIGMSGAF